jgi:tRNA threonylcarbamoyladenosine biosynthesis protein TsaB
MYLLNIETATRMCSVGLSEGGNIMAIRESREKNVHAALVSIFAEEVCREAGIKMKMLDAVSVSMGPGSYTGLRIGVSTAKGFCYALDIPLIAVPTLQSLALEALPAIQDKMDNTENILLCPMIDARRMEVYTALFDPALRQVKDTEAMIIETGSFDEELKKHTICYFGDGAEKCRQVLSHEQLIFSGHIHPSAKSLARLSEKKFRLGEFEDPAYFEPYYLKDFIAGKPRVKGLE